MNTARLPQPRTGRHHGDGSAAYGGFDDATIERLLRGDRQDDPTAALLARVLDAAAAPATPDELRHAETVFAAHAACAKKRSGLAAVLFGRTARPLGLNLAAAVVAATAAGGLALAAATGVLPTPLHPRPAQSHSGASPKPVASSAAASLKPRPIPSALTAPNIAALCTAYSETSQPQRDKALAAPGFAALVAAAGGVENVAAYCATAARTPAAHVTPSHHPTGKPTAYPSEPTTGRQSIPAPAHRTR
jgi:hypothetical protein